MLLRSGHPVPSDLEFLARVLRSDDQHGYATELRKEIVQILLAHPPNSISDLDHYFTLGLAVRSIWPASEELFDRTTLAHLERVGRNNGPAILAFWYGLSGSTFDKAVARILKETEFSPRLLQTQEVQHS
jgi:hypothetical protein